MASDIRMATASTYPSGAAEDVERATEGSRARDALCLSKIDRPNQVKPSPDLGVRPILTSAFGVLGICCAPTVPALPPTRNSLGSRGVSGAARGSRPKPRRWRSGCRGEHDVVAELLQLAN